MRGLAVFDNPDGFEISEEPFDSGEEEEFEELLETRPELLPAPEINPLIKAIIPIGRQVTAGNNSIDLLFLADTGHLLVVECKLIQNPEARREVVPQLLEYSLTIRTGWDSKHVMSLAEEYFSRRKSDSNENQTVTARLNMFLKSRHVEQPPLTESILKKRIDRQIKNPLLVIAGNRIEQRALVLSDFLRTLTIPIVCLEIRRYRVGNTRFLAGYVKAASLLSTVSAGQREAITEEEWLSLIEDESFQAIRKDFLDWAKRMADEGLVDIRIGSKELMVGMTKSQKRKTVLSLSHRLWINFFNFRELGCEDSVVQEYRDRVERVFGPRVLGPGRYYPSVPLSAITEDAKREALKSLLSSLIKQTNLGNPSEQG